MRDTRGLIMDVRLNGGGDEPTAGAVAGRFLQEEFVYAYSQYRNGPSHTNLTESMSARSGLATRGATTAPDPAHRPEA
jgi:C-terminal processing protease CtpA/Prc